MADIINKDSKLLIIVESPTKVKHIDKILKELDYKNIRVFPSVGHITEIQNRKDSYKNTGVYPEQNFKVAYIVSEEKHKVVEDLKAQVKWADLVILATDPDREGHNIAWHLKETLKLKDSQYFRITYQSITKEAIKEAFEHPYKLDINLIAAAEARQVIDKMIGYALSPIAKTYVGAKSVGRCQSIGLKFIIDREEEIENFVSETYFDLYLNFEKNNAAFKAKYIGTDLAPVDRLKTQAAVDKVIAECINDYTIKSIVGSKKIESAPLPFITATIQQEVTNKLGLGVKDVMSICQKNFEAGYTTYHRVDTPILSPEFVVVAKPYIEATFGANNYFGSRPVKLSDDTQNGHEAIRCTDITLTPEKAKAVISNSLQLKVYNLIWKRTVQSLMTNAIFDAQTITIENNNHLFKFEQKVLVDPGFKLIK